MVSPPASTNAADAVAAALADAGVERVFGVPGGGSSLDLIAAAHRRGLPFALARHETAAVIMAATTAELSGRPGAALVTRGPAFRNAANGIAHASLDRAPLLLVADGFTGAERAFANHQWFDHAAMLAPVTKAAAKAVEPGTAAGPMTAALLAAALAAPCGPVLLEMSGAAARAPAALPPPPGPASASNAPDAAALGRARTLLAEAKRPVLIAGSGSRDSGELRRSSPFARGSRLPRSRDLQGERRGAGRASALRGRLHRRRGGSAGARGGGPHPPRRRRPGRVHPPALALRARRSWTSAPRRARRTT